MVSTIGKAVVAGMTCGALGLGLGALWASESPQQILEPMKSMVKPPPVSGLSQPLSATSGEDSAEEPDATRVGASAPNEMAGSATKRTADDSQGHGSAAHGSESTPSHVAPTEALAVRRLVVTNRIEGREPAAVSEFSANGEEVYAFVELTNASAREQRIEIVFEHESGQEVGFVKLPVPKDKTRWRTWGQTRQIKKSGRWVAKVRDASGAELLRQSFVVGQG